MKILFFEPYTVNIHHWGTCLELMERHLLKGDDIYFAGCYSDLSACDVNPDIDLRKCLMCIDREYEGLSKLSGNHGIKKIRMSQLISKEEQKMLRGQHTYESLHDLKKMSYKDFHDLGYAVLSSLITWRRDPYPDINKERGLIDRMIDSSKLVYEYALKLIDRIQPDQAYVYNGRHAIVRAAFRACKAKGVKVSLHEVGSDLSKFLVDHDALLHEISAVRKRIHEFWEDQTVDENAKLIRANEFYELRRQGVVKGWFSFTKDQKTVLPQDWNESQRNIVFFTSSEDEFASIGDEWIPPIYSLQEEGIERIAKDLLPHRDIRLWIRLHPNMKNAPKKSLEPYLKLNLENVTVILPDDEVSSYLLLDRCEKVVSFGSTMGIEAAFWDKPSILLGISIYKTFQSVYEPSTHEEALALILEEKLPVLPKEGALKYGYYIGNFGTDYQYMRKTGIFTGVFKDWDFRNSRKYERIMTLLEYRLLDYHDLRYLFKAFYR